MPRPPCNAPEENRLARAKNTSRAVARRRTREALRAELLEAEADDVQPNDPQEAVAERPRLFRMPDVRADLRALPSVFRSRLLIWVPLLLLFVGLVLELVLRGLPTELGGLAVLFNQFFFYPPALFVFFIAGFVAPRASYLVGLIYGLIAGVLWTLAAVAVASALGLSTDVGAGEVGAVLAQMVVSGAVYGTLAAAFAAWYRDFLRGMQERGKARRAEQEAKERAKRRDERQEARRVAKRPTS
jgi:hypothetical protein